MEVCQIAFSQTEWVYLSHFSLREAIILSQKMKEKDFKWMSLDKVVTDKVTTKIFPRTERTCKLCCEIDI